MEISKLGIKEDFVPVDIKSLDSKNRISLGDRVKKVLLRKMKVDAFQIFIGEEGDVLLRPLVNVPAKEAWLFKNPEALKVVKEGIKEAKTGKIKKVLDLDEFIENL